MVSEPEGAGGADGFVDIIDYTLPRHELAIRIANAVSTSGFFQLVNHTIDDQVTADFEHEMRAFFALPDNVKHALRRSESNSRGYLDDELTKQKRDWKECLDIGMPRSRNWDIPDASMLNACLDGLNQFPVNSNAFRSAVTKYYDACAKLSHELASLMSEGLGITCAVTEEALLGSSNNAIHNDNANCENYGHHGNDNVENKNNVGNRVAQDESALLENLHRRHTSFLRLNHYPPTASPTGCHGDAANEHDPVTDVLGISPHTDAGFLTVLKQDPTCHSLQVLNNSEWVTVHPVPGSVTINTGDMAQIWSNGVARAPLHRVKANKVKERFSAPFFYNPGYDAIIRPCVLQATHAQYLPCSWGYFRAVRFAGDLTDIGTEVQISDFSVDAQTKSQSNHVARQTEFLRHVDYDQPFSVMRYRKLLED